MTVAGLERVTNLTREMINVGEICGTRGLQGELKVLPLTDFPERFKGMEKIWVECGPGSGYYKIEYCRPYKQFLLFKFAGINTVEAAGGLVKGLLKVDEKEVFPLPEDTHYIFQLLGLKVDDLEKGPLGVVTDVLKTGANDVYVVKGDRYGEVLIPAIKDVVLDIDLTTGRMKVRLLPGLMDEV
ncbi:MAG: ribosome maturation factor RimM [Syntrophomonadales bacterium]